MTVNGSGNANGRDEIDRAVRALGRDVVEQLRR